LATHQKLSTIEVQVPKRKTMHAIVDNCATHKHPKVREWLMQHPRWTFRAGLSKLSQKSYRHRD
jgi:hypothetical protein